MIHEKFLRHDRWGGPYLNHSAILLHCYRLKLKFDQVPKQSRFELFLKKVLVLFKVL